MGYKALITIDTTATADQRKMVYEHLEKENWQKIPKLTTSWKATFNDTTSREDAIKVLVSDLEKAKKVSGATNVEYAMQLDKIDVNMGHQQN